MFKKVLVANRGEIACRVFKTAKSLGIKTVAVYSDADAQALHTKMADQAIHIGAAPAAESYLMIDKIIDACKQTGAEAVHPGYGFLSERADFASRLAKENIIFIGPSEHAIEKMGDKITSKKIAADAGVSTVQGFMGLIDDADHAVKIARDIGYPVMIKASAGGGGKGMRIAYDDEEAKQGFARAKSEAASSFGDDRIFIEKFIEQPRHIEIQILADNHGNCVYLGERECSIQRRNQKVIEEAPSPFLDEKTRQAMGAQSCALAKAVGYASAGTVEFIVDKDKNFYFLEMNTRLQVEHPVTELVTGIDLVEQMLNVAAGHRLALTQDDIKMNGWAIESRLYAEDPYRNFLPSTGRLTRYRPPQEGALGDDGQPAIRNDTGVFEGGEISIFYDPMIAKLCSWGKDRPTAIKTMARALDQFEVEGISHNLPLCAAVMRHERFISGEISTAFIAEEYPDGFKGTALNISELTALALDAAIMKWCDDARLQTLGGANQFADMVSEMGWRSYSVRLSDKEFEIRTRRTPHSRQGTYDILLGSEGAQTTHNITSDYAPGTSRHQSMITDFPCPAGPHYFIQSARTATGYRMRHQGADLQVQVLRPHVAKLARLMPEKQVPDTSDMLLCPMPGLVVKLYAHAGDKVEQGQALAIVEAMKMENVLYAAKSGTIAAVPVAEGDSLAVDAMIMEFEA